MDGTKKKVLLVAIDPILHRRVKMAAASLGLSIKGFVIQILEKALTEKEKTNRS